MHSFLDWFGAGVKYRAEVGGAADMHGRDQGRLAPRGADGDGIIQKRMNEGFRKIDGQSKAIEGIAGTEGLFCV